MALWTVATNIGSVATLLEFFGVEGEIFEPQPGRQSLIYRVPGTEPEAPSLALVPHLDVVPVDESGWTQDPFGAEIIDGFVYGRGAVDMLNVTAAIGDGSPSIHHRRSRASRRSCLRRGRRRRGGREVRRETPCRSPLGLGRGRLSSHRSRLSAH